MPPEILLTLPMPARTEAVLAERHVVHRLHEAPDRAALLGECGPRVRALVTGEVTGANRALLDALPALEIVAVAGIGLDAVDVDRARDRRIRVTTTPDVLTADVADMALALLLAASRRICASDRYVREGRWPSGPAPLGRRVSGQRLGILGMGRVGRAIGHRAEAFDMDVSYTDLMPVPGTPYRYVPGVLALAGACDALVVAASGGRMSRNLVDGAVLDALGPEGVLVNVARGSVVDEPALLDALREGRLGAAGLDVFAHEPQVPEGFLALDNVVLQPHRASATMQTRLAMGAMVLDSLDAHFAGREPPGAAAGDAPDGPGAEHRVARPIRCSAPCPTPCPRSLAEEPSMISVRHFEEADAPELAVVMTEMVAFYGSPLAVEGPLADDIIRQARDVALAVAFSGDRIAGFVTYGFLYPVSGLRSFAYLQQVYVASAHRRSGVARRLMAFVARACQERGCTWMEWSTGRDNAAARAFYEGLGATGSEKIAYELTGDALRGLASSSG